MDFKKPLFILVILFASVICKAQDLAPTPPMGFMSWNYFTTHVNAKDMKEIADSMVANGMVEAGYEYLCIDDGWQGGRDSVNNIIANPKKFPKGMKAFVDYIHSKGMKVGIYSDPAQLTCAGYTGSLNFEEQDAKTFAKWGIDYLKYDYCNAPRDLKTEIVRNKRMADALRHSGRNIVFAVCEEGVDKPWLWAAQIGGQLWRTTFDIRDKWKNLDTSNHNSNGILDILNLNADLAQYAGPGHWNDPDMLAVGLNGNGGVGGNGCTMTEYQSQMSLWCLMAAPLMVTCDIRHMGDSIRRILLNKDIIAIDQDPLGKQAVRKINNKKWEVFVKPLANGDYAVGVLNLTGRTKNFNMDLSELGLLGKYNGFDVWTKETMKNLKRLKFEVAAHETKVIRLSK